MAIKQYLRAVLERFMSEEELAVFDANYHKYKHNKTTTTSSDQPITPEEEKIAELWLSSNLSLGAFAKALGITRDRVTTILVRVDKARFKAKQQ